MATSAEAADLLIEIVQRGNHHPKDPASRLRQIRHRNGCVETVVAVFGGLHHRAREARRRLRRQLPALVLRRRARRQVRQRVLVLALARVLRQHHVALGHQVERLVAQLDQLFRVALDLRRAAIPVDQRRPRLRIARLLGGGGERFDAIFLVTIGMIAVEPDQAGERFGIGAPLPAVQEHRLGFIQRRRTAFAHQRSSERH